MPHQRLRQGTIDLSLVIDGTNTEDDIRNTRAAFLMTFASLIPHLHSQTIAMNK